MLEIIYLFLFLVAYSLIIGIFTYIGIMLADMLLGWLQNSVDEWRAERYRKQVESDMAAAVVH